jgi:hypothetical protein
MNARERFFAQREAAQARRSAHDGQRDRERRWHRELHDSGYGRDNSPGSACGPPARLPAFSLMTEPDCVLGYWRRECYVKNFGWPPGFTP